MPQMSPLLWLWLYILFSIIFLLFNFLNYYLYLIKSKKILDKKTYSSKILNWKW